MYKCLCVCIYAFIYIDMYRHVCIIVFNGIVTSLAATIFGSMMGKIFIFLYICTC
jgi:hypothetical protein